MKQTRKPPKCSSICCGWNAKRGCSVSRKDTGSHAKLWVTNYLLDEYFAGLTIMTAQDDHLSLDRSLQTATLQVEVGSLAGSRVGNGGNASGR